MHFIHCRLSNLIEIETVREVMEKKRRTRKEGVKIKGGLARRGEGQTEDKRDTADYCTL